MLDFDLSAYITAAVAGVPLLFVVMGLTHIWGQLGAEGKVQLASALGTGVILGTLYMVSQVRPPVGDWYEGFVYWFSSAFYGIGLGVLAVTGYETLKNVTYKAVGGLLAKYSQRIE
jgi:hypothetical protein